MLGLKYMIVITKREYSEHYLAFFRKTGVTLVNSVLCNGTASGSTLDLLGLEKTENLMLQAVVPDNLLTDVKKGLVASLKIDEPGNGIAVFVQLDGVGGEWSLNKLIGTTEVVRKEGEFMSELSNSVLIITIVDKGYNDDVMDAAREAGAGGGTVVRAKGTGASLAKFFGVSMSEEKEMVYIVSGRENRDAIMKAIIEKAGGKTKAHGIVFSLPVDSVLGIRSFENV